MQVRKVKKKKTKKREQLKEPQKKLLIIENFKLRFSIHRLQQKKS